MNKTFGQVVAEDVLGGMHMYRIMRHGRRFGNLTFTSYERAREHVRNYLRKNYSDALNNSGEGAYVGRYGNGMGLFGFQIKKI